MWTEKTRRRVTSFIRRRGLPLLVVAGVISTLRDLPAVSRLFANEEQSLAVLPFTHVRDKSVDEYFADGLTEEVIVSLTGLSAIRVVDLETVMPYKRSIHPAEQIAEELRVSHVLIGTIEPVVNENRIVVHLFERGVDKQIWTGRYNVPFDPVFKTQTETARYIANEVREKLSPR